MPTAVDIAIDLGEVTAWLAAWEHSDEDVRRENKAHCREIVIAAWEFLFDDTPVAARLKVDPDRLAVDLRAVRQLIERWEDTPAQQRKGLAASIRSVLGQILGFFA